MNEHEFEPTPGLPGPLPKGETILWQGAPDWQAFATRALWVKWIVAYFAILAAWGIADQIASGTPAISVALATTRLAALAAVAVGLLLLFAWLVGRTTLYTITTSRIVIRFGIALPMTIQIPFRVIDAAGVTVGSEGIGDIALTLRPQQRIGYLILWPHARPWKLAHAQPALRSLPDAAGAAQILGRALSAAAEQPAEPVRIEVAAESGGNAHVPAAA